MASPHVKTTPRRPAGSEGALSERYQLFMDFMDIFPDAVYFKDKQGRFIFVNRAFVHAMGLKAGQIIGKTAHDLYPKDLARTITQDDQYIFETGRPIVDKIEKRTTKKGGDYFVSVTKVPRYDDRQQLIGLMGVARDVTRRVQFDHLREEKILLQRKLEMAEDLSRVKSEFISMISHELRTPLAIIQQLWMLIYDETTGPINDRQREILVRIRNNMGRLKGIIEELLDISRIEGKKFSLHYVLVDMVKLCRDSEDFFKQVAAEKKIKVSYAVPAKDVNLFIDPERITQVISNLMMNAVKFTGEGGRIRLEVKILEYKIRVGIHDNGVGLSKENLTRVFDKFMQVSPSGSDQRKGIGLGLSIAKELVEQHGGEIWADSTPGKGSSFYFTLPRYYTANVLSKAACTRINRLLERRKSVHLINLLIINYKEFKKKVGIASEKFFVDLKKIALAAFRETFPEEVDTHIFISDVRSGRFSIIFPEAAEKKVAAFCELLKKRTKGYFIEHKLEDVFIALGVLAYPSTSKAVDVSRPAPTNLIMKELYIGAEMRVSKRIVYKTSIEILSPKTLAQFSETVDVSLHGLCFISQFPIKMNTRMKLSFRLLRRNQVLTLAARAAWMRKMDRLPGDPVERFKIGVEFYQIKPSERAWLDEELRLYYE